MLKAQGLQIFMDQKTSSYYLARMAKTGKLYLIPTPLGEGGMHVLPKYLLDVLHRIKVLIAERPKTARHFMKASGFPHPLQEVTYFELNKRTAPAEYASFLQPALQGQDTGLVSEAGSPGVADPGAAIVSLAHKKGIEVVPLVGPSSILLALMASGMNGQSFAFHGYLPQKRPELVRELKRLEQMAIKHDQTQLFIETPYRNSGLIETVLQTLQNSTRFCIAADLTLPTEYIRTKNIAEWKKSSPPNLHKRPAIFLIFHK